VHCVCAACADAVQILYSTCPDPTVSVVESMVLLNSTAQELCSSRAAEVMVRLYDYSRTITSYYCKPSYDLMLKGSTCSACYSYNPKHHHACGRDHGSVLVPVAASTVAHMPISCLCEVLYCRMEYYAYPMGALSQSKVMLGNQGIGLVLRLLQIRGF